MPRIPLFPLPVVLLPGMRMPLHIFEPRYREMLRDCLAGDRRFGLIFKPETATDEIPAIGAVGCHAHIEDVETLPDGRSNIVVLGHERFSVVDVDSGSAPYLVARVGPFHDNEEPVAQLTALSLRLHELFSEAAFAARALTDDGGSPPQLTDDPEYIAFGAAALINLEPEQRQRLLASPSPSGRMREMIALLDAALPDLARRAQVHRRARGNGHGSRPVA